MGLSRSCSRRGRRHASRKNISCAGALGAPELVSCEPGELSTAGQQACTCTFDAHRHTLGLSWPLTLTRTPDGFDSFGADQRICETGVHPITARRNPGGLRSPVERLPCPHGRERRSRARHSERIAALADQRHIGELRVVAPKIRRDTAKAMTLSLPCEYTAQIFWPARAACSPSSDVCRHFSRGTRSGPAGDARPRYACEGTEFRAAG
jgi:hypothetical protein